MKPELFKLYCKIKEESESYIFPYRISEHQLGGNIHYDLLELHRNSLSKKWMSGRHNMIDINGNLTDLSYKEVNCSIEQFPSHEFIKRAFN
jgi:hypothetical protein